MNTLTYEELIDGKDVIRFRNDEEVAQVLDFDPEEKPDVIHDELPVPEGILTIETNAHFPDKVVRFSITEEETVTVELMWRSPQEKYNGRRAIDDPCTIRAKATIDMKLGEVSVIHFDHDYIELAKQRKLFTSPEFKQSMMQSSIFKDKAEMKEYMEHAKKISAMSPTEMQQERIEAFKFVARAAIMANLYILFGQRPGSRRVRHHVSKKNGRRKKPAHVKAVKMAKAVFELGSPIPRPKVKEVAEQVEKVQEVQQKRSYTMPNREIPVRGHWRNYKNGKRVFIEPTVRNKGKAKRSTKIFQL